MRPATSALPCTKKLFTPYVSVTMEKLREQTYGKDFFSGSKEKQAPTSLPPTQIKMRILLC